LLQTEVRRKSSEGTRLASKLNKIRGGGIMNANKTLGNKTQLGKVGQQARLLMRGDRQREQNRQASMLNRVASEVGLE